MRGCPPPPVRRFSPACSPRPAPRSPRLHTGGECRPGLGSGAQTGSRLRVPVLRLAEAGSCVAHPSTRYDAHCAAHEVHEPDTGPRRTMRYPLDPELTAALAIPPTVGLGDPAAARAEEARRPAASIEATHARSIRLCRELGAVVSSRWPTGSRLSIPTPHRGRTSTRGWRGSPPRGGPGHRRDEDRRARPVRGRRSRGGGRTAPTGRWASRPPRCPGANWPRRQWSSAAPSGRAEERDAGLLRGEAGGRRQS